MIMTAYSEPSVVGRSLRARWATTTSSLEESEMVDVSASSDVASYPTREILLAVVPYARPSDALPHHCGIVVLCAASAEQNTLIESAVWAANSGPYSTMQRRDLLPNALVRSYGRSGPSPVSTEELLDWDTAIKTPPPRPSGSISVTLRYAGRSTPSPVTDSLDE